MERLLKETLHSAGGAILCLTWRAGLTVEQLCALQWNDISFVRKELWAGHRRVPLEEDTVRCLQSRLQHRRAGDAPCVLLTSQHKPMLPVSVYRLARRMLDREPALRSTTLKLLREDYQIQHRREEQGGAADEYMLWKILQAEGTSPAGVALWMLWRMGLRLREITELTWDAVDMEQGVLHLSGREVSMGVALPRLLRQVRQTRQVEDAPYVLLTPRSRRPYDPARLSRCVGAALRRGGAEGIRPGELSRMHLQRETENKLMLRLEQRGKLSRQEAAGQLGLSAAAAYRRLAALTQRGKLERIGAKYYPMGTAVPEKEAERVVCEYLERENDACCRQLADLLGIESRQCGRILRRMELEGRLTRRNRRYQICREEKK